MVGSNIHEGDFIRGNIAEARDVLRPMGKASTVSDHVNLDWMMMLRGRKDSSRAIPLKEDDKTPEDQEVGKINKKYSE